MSFLVSWTSSVVASTKMSSGCHRFGLDAVEDEL